MKRIFTLLLCLTLSFILSACGVSSFDDCKEDREKVVDLILDESVEIAELSPSWANSQPWNVYIATGESLRKIREKWIGQNASEIEGNSDLPSGHREDFGERALNNMNQLFGSVI